MTRQFNQINALDINAFEAIMCECKHIYWQIHPYVFLELSDRYSRVMRINDNSLASARVEDEPLLDFFVICHCYFDLQSFCCRRNVNLEYQEWLEKAKGLSFRWWYLYFGCRAFDTVDWSLHFLVEHLLNIFCTSINFEVVQRVFASSREYFYGCTTMICMFKHYYFVKFINSKFSNLIFIF